MIYLCGNSTGFDGDALIPGGQSDRYLRPIFEALPLGAAEIVRQPVEGAVCALTNHWSAYRDGAANLPRWAVQLSHGIADKGYRSRWRMLRFDFVVFPGPALAELARRELMPTHKIQILGYPKLDPILRGEVESPWPERDGRVRVLYAPTHGGGSERHRNGNPHAPGAKATTWWHRDELLSLLDPERFLVMEAPHPRHSPERQATFAQYVGADVVIADGGSTMYEAWICGLPVVFADWLTAARNLSRARGRLLEHRVYAEGIGWHSSKPESFARMVARAAEVGQTTAETRFSEYVLPTDLRGHGGELHAEFLLELERGRYGPGRVRLPRTTAGQARRAPYRPLVRTGAVQ